MGFAGGQKRKAILDLLAKNADFQSRKDPLLVIYSSELVGRPLPNLQHNAGRCRASSRKIHADCPHEFFRAVPKHRPTEHLVSDGYLVEPHL
jgi:hypothetical protein